MSGEVAAFWVFAVVALGAAIAMVTMRNVVHGALMLVLNLLAVAGLFLTLQSSFMAIVQVIVYAGAIMVLFLFVLMLLGVSRDDALMERRPSRRFAAWVLAAVLATAVALAFVGPYTGPSSVCGRGSDGVAADEQTCIGLDAALEDADDSSVVLIAERLFTRYTFAFEFVSLLLIVAIVGALMLGRRRDPPALIGEPAELEPLLADHELITLRSTAALLQTDATRAVD